MVIVELSVGRIVENKSNRLALKSRSNINHERRLVVLWLEAELRVVNIGSLLIIAFQSVAIGERGDVRKHGRENTLVGEYTLLRQSDLDDERGSKAVG